MADEIYVLRFEKLLKRGLKVLKPTNYAIGTGKIQLTKM